ncbi:inner mitochondrial membrane protein Sco1p-like protein [Fulvimarina pelagi HTCC2506]|uniref:Inner mitochondrial membrane protein Sco1p-like protein n=2 Tax=Fulvimarina pelagi TaxID=217511 RepID=Q0G2W9_9HYPH|nr:SCO family protein [Fulvimarina pelagi]EAU42062.1 inner mitochondrial membrane protein Sco1p-like protein [Fulvimarina pelagi HTCC2506]BAT31030.1 inner mitochondrial membrane protein Sco1p-like protein [Fulvimarina pelagi]
MIKRAHIGLAAVMVLAFLVSAVFIVAFDDGRSRAASTDPLAMTDQNGEPVTQSLFEGKPTALFFGFTHCPEVCPTTLAELSLVLNELGPKADDLNVVFVTVDPERDTPDVLADYVGAFDERIVALTGSHEQLDAMAENWGVYYKKVPLKDGDYTMDHTATVFLLNRGGEFTGTIGFGEDSEMAFRKLLRLVDQS